MKKSSKQFCLKMKVINDGATFYHKEHYWKGWIPLTNKDISSHYMWKDGTSETNKLENQQSYITDYAKKFTKSKNKTTLLSN